jgi:hypothetical protein
MNVRFRCAMPTDYFLFDFLLSFEVIPGTLAPSHRETHLLFLPETVFSRFSAVLCHFHLQRIGGPQLDAEGRARVA